MSLKAAHGRRDGRDTEEEERRRGGDHGLSLNQNEMVVSMMLRIEGVVQRRQIIGMVFDYFLSGILIENVYV